MKRKIELYVCSEHTGFLRGGELVCFLHYFLAFVNPLSDCFFDCQLHVSLLESVLFGDCLSELLFKVAVYRKVDFDVFLVFLFHG